MNKVLLMSYELILITNLYMKVDKRAVLKHSGWPELKADTMHGAAFDHCDLKMLDTETLKFHSDRKNMQVNLTQLFWLQP